MVQVALHALLVLAVLIPKMDIILMGAHHINAQVFLAQVAQEAALQADVQGALPVITIKAELAIHAQVLLALRVKAVLIKHAIVVMSVITIKTATAMIVLLLIQIVGPVMIPGVMHAITVII